MTNPSKDKDSEQPNRPELPSPATLPAKRPPAPEPLEDKLLAKAKTPEERTLAFTLASRVRQADMVRAAATAIAETGWGKDISPVARAAVGRYLLELGADPVRHAYVLGGSTVYLNAEFYQDLCAANPDFLKAEMEFIHDDARLPEEERQQRKRKRIDVGAPEASPGIAIVTLHYGHKGPFVGFNWVKVGKTSSGKDRDPIGLEHPSLTAHTRAYRKAAKQAEPAWFGKHPRLSQTEGIEVGVREIPQTLPEPVRD